MFARRYRFALSCLALCASSLASAADLTIEVADIKASQGSVNVALYASADTFLKQPLNALIARRCVSDAAAARDLALEAGLPACPAP